MSDQSGAPEPSVPNATQPYAPPPHGYPPQQYPAQPYPGQAYPGQAYPGQAYGTQPYAAGYPQPYPPQLYPPQPGYGYPSAPVAPSRGRLPEGALPAPIAVHAVVGTPFGVALVPVAPTSSGPASASLVAGIGSILVALVVACFGTAGAQAGWGPTVAGAFAVLSIFAGAAAVALGTIGRRQVRRGSGAVRGGGLALAGLICGSVGLVAAIAIFLIALAAAQPA